MYVCIYLWVVGIEFCESFENCQFGLVCLCQLQEERTEPMYNVQQFMIRRHNYMHTHHYAINMEVLNSL